MAKINKDEVLKIAHMSDIEIKEHEIAPMQEQLEAVLTYAHRVTQVARSCEEPSAKNINIMREDIEVHCNAQPILAQAPERAGDFFVVPKIIDQN